jgi:hypothetical protein
MSKLDWQNWFEGMWRAVIVGGTGAFTATCANGYFDPKDNNLTTWPGLHHALLVGAFTFFGAAFLHMVMFLNAHPLPDPEKPEK